MNERFKELAAEAFFDEATNVSTDKMYHFGEAKMQLFAESIVQDCADQIRSNYDHEHAESVAWSLEIEYGLHGDHAE